MMYDELYQYLIRHKQMNVPGIGNFLLHKRSAEADFLNKCIHPPFYEIALQQTTVSASRKFFSWLGNALNISEGEAVIRFNDFAFDMKKQIIAGNKIEWNGVGVLTNGSGNEIKFTASPGKIVIGESVPAEKVIREHAEHAVLVGEKERTSVEMTEYFNKPEKKRSLWWAYALGIGILAVMFISWYFSEHGLNVSSTANQQSLVPEQTEATYNSLH